MTVEKISLLYTVFTRIDKMQIVQVPNIQLNNLWIENVTRSKAMKEVIDVNVSFDTSFEEIELLRMEMENFVRSPENSRDFQPDIGISVGGVGDLDKLTLKVVIKHKSNWHNEMVRATRRSKFMCALTLALKRVPINGPGGGGDALGGPKNPTYAVAVSDDFAAQAREKSEKEKEEKKLANQLAEGTAGDSSAKVAEERAVDDLNASDPVTEALEEWGYENTLNSRDPSADRKRATEIEAARRDFTNARESQRGRRKAGDTLPPTAFGNSMPSVQVTRSVSSRGSRNPTSFDIERQAGMQGPSLAQYAGAAYAVQNAGIPLATYPIPPAPQPAHTQQSSLTVQGQTHPLQSAPSGSGVTGARSRGASVSHPQPQRTPSEGQGGQPGGSAPAPGPR